MTEAEKAYQYFVIAVPENEEQAKAYFWARKALQPTLTPPNEPLTLEQLREMDGEPVWVDFSGSSIEREPGWFILKNTDGEEVYLVGKVSVYKAFEYYGKAWLAYAYRRPPEGEED